MELDSARVDAHEERVPTHADSLLAYTNRLIYLMIEEPATSARRADHDHGAACPGDGSMPAPRHGNRRS